MKKYLIILTLLCAGVSYGQPPRIDSMVVDEAKSELQIHGDFGSPTGAVWVDSIMLTIKTWTDSFIVATIAPSGKGSAGPVVVAGRSYRSDARMLTMWGMGASWAKTFSGSLSLKYVHEEWTLSWRVDIDSRLRHAQTGLSSSTPISARSGEEYTYHYNWHDPSNPMNSGQEDDAQHANGFTFGQIDLNSLTFFFKVNELVTGKYYFSTFYNVQIKSILDSALVPQGGSQNTDNDTPNPGIFTWGNEFILKSYVLFPPSKSVLLLREHPMLSAPDKDTILSNTDGVLLLWDSLSLLNNYHLQVSNDSLFVTKLIDSFVLPLSITLPPLSKNTKFFWRVAGVNSEGETRWSEVWNFTTGATADVQAGDNTMLTLSSFPNPSAKELTIVYSLPGSENARVVLYDLEGRLIHEALGDAYAGEHRMKWDISQLPSGNFVLGLITEKERKTQIVQIVH